MEKIETLGRRLGQLMEERSLNYDRLGRLLDMKPQTLNRYVLGQREPKARVATEMAMKLEVDPLWLQGYDVPKSAAKAAAPGGGMVPVLAVLPADVPDVDQFFFLRTADNSMSGGGIQAGDLVLIRLQSTARSGQLVLFSMDGAEPVLRRFYQQGDWAIVQQECPHSLPLLLSAAEFEAGTARILGVAVSLTRQLEV